MAQYDQEQQQVMAFGLLPGTAQGWEAEDARQPVECSDNELKMPKVVGVEHQAVRSGAFPRGKLGWPQNSTGPATGLRAMLDRRQTMPAGSKTGQHQRSRNARQQA